MKAQRIKALLTKEFFQMIRDPSSLLIAGLLPMILLFIFGYGISLDMKNLKVGVLLEDTSVEIRSFVDGLASSDFFDVYFAKNRSELTQKITNGDIKGFIIIPSYFSDFNFNKNLQAPFYVVSDGSDPNTANFVQNYISAAWNNWLEHKKADLNSPTPPSIQPIFRFWYNEELDSRNFLLPGSIAIVMTLIGTLLTALVIAREWERGTIESLMATPITIWELLLGKIIPYFCLGLCSMAICTVISLFVFNLPFYGSILALSLVCSLFLLASLETGLLISFFSRNQFVASQAALLISFLPAYMLSGFVFEISSMPKAIQFLTYILPARYFVSCLKTIFLVGDVWKLFWPNILAMLAFIVILFLMIAKTFIKRLD